MSTFYVNNKQVITSLFDFIIEENLTKDFNIDNVKLKAKLFYDSHLVSKLPEEKLELVKELEDFSLYDLSNYNSFVSSEELVPSLVMVLSIFKLEVIKLLASDTEDKLYMDFGGLKRKVSPPSEAYDYVGNNKLDIKPTNRSYGLLFE